MSVIKKCENWCSLSKSCTAFYCHDYLIRILQRKRYAHYNARRRELRYVTANAAASRFPKNVFMANYGVAYDSLIATEGQTMRHYSLNYNAIDILRIKYKNIDF